MIIILKKGTGKEVSDAILQSIKDKGLKPLYMPGKERVVLGALGDERVLESLHLENHPDVEEVKPILAPYKMVAKEFHPADTIVKIGNAPFGGSHFTVIAGPCAVESEEQYFACAEAVKKSGAKVFRGGAFKPRSSPYSFQGLGQQGLEILKRATEKYDIPTVTEIVDVADVEAVERHSGAFQIGARNMQNFSLLKAVGQTKHPVILKRGMAAKVDDLLLAAEYILSEGNPNVILCERGIRTFETSTRNTLDLNAIPYIKQRSHLPVIVDPSHGTGVRDFVGPLAKAAAAVGADGVIIEVHTNPEKALSDGMQSLYPKQFETLMNELRAILKCVGKELV